MVTHVDADVQQLWRDYQANPTDELRNQLVEHYLELVKYNADRIWQRLPDGVDKDDLISAGVFGLMDAISAFDLDRAALGSTLQEVHEIACLAPSRGGPEDGVAALSSIDRRLPRAARKAIVCVDFSP